MLLCLFISSLVLLSLYLEKTITDESIIIRLTGSVYLTPLSRQAAASSSCNIISRTNTAR